MSREARDIVVIGASSGGFQAIPELLSWMPPTIPGAFFVVLHMPEGYEGDFAGWIARRCSLATSFATDGGLIEKGHVYVAHGGTNLSLERGRTAVQASPRESYHRPSINALFRSAALTYGRRAVGVILTGTLEDGAAGAWEIWHRGGIVIVQDPTEARYPGLPKHVINSVPVDYCAPLRQIADLVLDFATQPRRGSALLGNCEARVMIGAFRDGHSALMLTAARQRHVASTKWGKRRYLSMEALLNPAKQEVAA